jgi:hypothetical protein
MFLRTFGCACWPNLRPFNPQKLEFRSKQCVFLGYSNHHKGFKCLEPTTGRIYISRDVVFDEHLFPFSKLHPNAGAQLRAELTLLPDILLNPTSTSEKTQVLDQCVSSSLPTNSSPNSTRELMTAGETSIGTGGIGSLSGSLTASGAAASLSLSSAPPINGAAGLSGPTANPAASDPFSSQQHAIAQPDSAVESGTPIPGLGAASSQ